MAARVHMHDIFLVQSHAWIGLCSVLRPRQHSIGYMGDGFYRSKEWLNQQYQSTEEKIYKGKIRERKQRKNTYLTLQKFESYI